MFFTMYVTLTTIIYFSDKEKKPVKPLEMSQKVYLAYCAREGIAPRQKLVRGLTEDTLDARNFVLVPEDVKAVAYALTVCTNYYLEGKTLTHMTL